MEIIFEDNDLLVVNKPAGLIVNNSHTSGSDTLQNIVSENITFEEMSGEIDAEEEIYESEFKQRGGIIHRLDKDTSGIILIGKNEPAFNRMQKQFKERSVEKEYLAIVLGLVEEEKFEINAPIKRNPNNRTKYAIVRDGKEAMTSFEKIRYFTDNNQNKYTVLKAYPKTGRTHQIRVHLSALGFPIAGDKMYSTRHQLENTNHFGRLMLHARSIRFNHPSSNTEMYLKADIPREFLPYLENL